MGVRKYFHKKLFSPIVNLLNQGVSPTKISISLLLGFLFAIVPVFGACTILCLAAIAIFRLNPIAILSINQIAYPLQFILYFPFIRTGEWVFNATPMSFSIDQIFDLFNTNLLYAIKTLWWSTMYGLVIWAIISSIVLVIVTPLLSKILARICR